MERKDDDADLISSSDEEQGTENQIRPQASTGNIVIEKSGKKRLTDKQKEALEKGRQAIAEKRKKQTEQNEQLKTLSKTLETTKYELKEAKREALKRFINDMLTERDKLLTASSKSNVPQNKRKRKAEEKKTESSEDDSSDSSDESDDDSEPVKPTKRKYRKKADTKKDETQFNRPVVRFG